MIMLNNQERIYTWRHKHILVLIRRYNNHKQKSNIFSDLGVLKINVYWSSSLTCSLTVIFLRKTGHMTRDTATSVMHAFTMHPATRFPQKQQSDFFLRRTVHTTRATRATSVMFAFVPRIMLPDFRRKKTYSDIWSREYLVTIAVKLVKLGGQQQNK